LHAMQALCQLSYSPGTGDPNHTNGAAGYDSSTPAQSTAWTSL
jgi:hypothetical protein